MKKILVKVARGVGLGRAVEKALTGRTPNTGQGSTQSKARELVDHYGSTKEAARAVGVNIRTIQRWLKGEQEAKNTARARNADNLDRAQREARVKDSRVERMKKSATGSMVDGGGKYPPTGGNALRIGGTFTVSSDTRSRTIEPGYWMPPGTLDAIRDVYVDQGPEAAGELLRDALDAYVPGMTVDSIDWIQF